MTGDLVEFLRARYAEEERFAKACAEVFPPPWDVNDRGHSASVIADAPNFLTVAQYEDPPHGDTDWPGARLEHVGRHDPARVLADIEAKRAIVDLYLNGVAAVDAMLGQSPMLQANFNALRRVLELLARPYADHPDCNPAWLVTR